MHRRITLADVAQRVGLSKAAVSMVLSNSPASRVSAEAAARIRAAADELGYRPNLTARSLSTRRSNVIGFVSELLTTNRFGSGLVRGALAEARRQGQVLFIAETEEEPAAAIEAVDLLIDHQVDRIIYAATRPHGVALPPRAQSTPHVVLNAVAAGARATVLPDEFDGARRIIDLLLDAGHRDDVVVLGRTRTHPRDSWMTVPVERRMAGISASLEAHGVVPIAEVACHPWSLENGYARMRELLLGGLRPQAVICLNDRLAFGAYRALGESGIRIPDDVSVVSFDDDDIAMYLDPTLTTVALPYEEMGALAVRLLLDPGSAQGEHLVPMPIRRRGSVGAVPPDTGLPGLSR